MILVTRFNQPLAHDYNTTLIKVFENHTIRIGPVSGIHVSELANSNELAVWVDSILGLMYIKKNVNVENKETLKTYQLDFDYMSNDNIFLAMQGYTLCFNLYEREVNS